MTRTSPLARRLAAWSFAALATAAGLIVPACEKKVSDNNIRLVSVPKLAEWLNEDPERYLVLDARRPPDFQAGHLPGATRIDLSQVDPASPEPSWERYRGFVVYGENAGSARAKALTKRLLQSAYSGVVLLDGGYEAWLRAGQPVVEPAAAAGSGSAPPTATE